MIERGKESLDAAERKIDPFGMQRQQSRQHGIDRHRTSIAGAHAGAGAIIAGVSGASAGSRDGDAPAGALSKSRHSLAIVERSA